MGAQHFYYPQNKVGCRNAIVKLAGKLETNHLGDKHGYGLPKHGCLSFNATNTPAQNSQTVDHCRVAIGTYQGIGIRDRATINLFGPYRPRQILKIHLMANTCSGRYNAEVIKRLLAPTQKPIALRIALHFYGDVLLKRIIVTKLVDHH